MSDQAVNDEQRYPLVAMIPVTGTPGEGALYQPLAPSASGLIKESYAFVGRAIGQAIR